MHSFKKDTHYAWVLLTTIFLMSCQETDGTFQDTSVVSLDSEIHENDESDSLGPENISSDNGDTESSDTDDSDSDVDSSESQVSDSDTTVTSVICDEGPFVDQTIEFEATRKASVISLFEQDVTSPKEYLIDDDVSTMFAMYRVEDYRFQLMFDAPIKVTAVTVTQPWSNWSQATKIRLENTYGETQFIEMQTNTNNSTNRDQEFEIGFEHPTKELRFHIIEAADGTLGSDSFGGIAEVRVFGNPAIGSFEKPEISNVDVQVSSNNKEATVSWTTSVPSYGRVMYSTDARLRLTSPLNSECSNRHRVVIRSVADGIPSSILKGLLRIESTTPNGEHALSWNDTLAQAGKIPGKDFLYGVGGGSFYVNDEWREDVDLFNMDNFHTDLTYRWLTPYNQWQTQLTPEKIRLIHEEGYQFQVLHWYWGDNPNRQEVLETLDNYKDSIRKLNEILIESGIGHNAVVTLEPEYNAPGGNLADWDGWNDIMIWAIDELHSGSGATVCLFAGNWDYENHIPISLSRAMTHADCIGTQHMAASSDETGTGGYWDPNSMEAQKAFEVKARNAVDSVTRFATYLREEFMRPVRWEWILISDYEHPEAITDWTSLQNEIGQDICVRQKELTDAGVVSVSWMAYMDVPDENWGPYGEAEKHKGLMYSDHTKKQIWNIWSECARNAGNQ